MKLSYCGLSENQKEFLHNRYNGGLEKFYYEKFKESIISCYKVALSLCVGISFSGIVIEELANVIGVAELSQTLAMAMCQGCVTIILTIWMLGYMACVMVKKPAKEFVFDLAKAFGMMFVSVATIKYCGSFLWQLIKLFL